MDSINNHCREFEKKIVIVGDMSAGEIVNGRKFLNSFLTASAISHVLDFKLKKKAR
jgi:hypothetical protein